MEIRETPRWALYPDGDWYFYKRGGAVTPAWFYNRPLYPAHVDVNDSEFGEHLLLCETCFPQLSWRAF